MTDQWAPTGDKWPQPAMVMVRRTTCEGASVPIGHNDLIDWISIYALHPMPPAITPEQQAVLDAAVEYVRDREDATRGGDYTKLLTAVRTMLAAQQPPDPVQELLEAAKAVAACDFCCSTAARERLRIAITALKTKS